MTVNATKEKPIEAEVLRQQPPVQPLATVPLPSRAAPVACGNLADALARAQQKCKPAPKDAHNNFHNYDYASAEAVIETAQQALAGTGLSLLPLEQSLNGWERTGENRFELVRKFLLLHASGESLPIQSAWPVVIEKGRPLDKATAIAATSSLAYLLRDLLLMARVRPEDDLNSLHDGEPARKPAPAPVKPTPAPAKPAARKPSNGKTPPGVVLAQNVKARDKVLAAQEVINADALLTEFNTYCEQNQFAADPKDWTEAQIQAVIAHMNKWEKDEGIIPTT